MQVAFDIDEFLTWFPGLAEPPMPEELLMVFWEQACGIVGCDDATSFAPYNPDAKPPVLERKALLYYVTCHLATLARRGDQPGRVASATEGSVSTSFDLIKANSQVAQWWNQTPCGSTYWALTAKYRVGGRLYIQSGYHPWG